MIFSSVIYLYRGKDIMTDKIFHDIIDSIINRSTDDEIEIIREKLNNLTPNHVHSEDKIVRNRTTISLNMIRIKRKLKIFMQTLS